MDLRTLVRSQDQLALIALFGIMFLAGGDRRNDAIAMEKKRLQGNWT